MSPEPPLQAARDVVLENGMRILEEDPAQPAVVAGPISMPSEGERPAYTAGLVIKGTGAGPEVEVEVFAGGSGDQLDGFGPDPRL